MCCTQCSCYCSRLQSCIRLHMLMRAVIAVLYSREIWYCTALYGTWSFSKDQKFGDGGDGGDERRPQATLSRAAVR